MLPARRPAAAAKAGKVLAAAAPGKRHEQLARKAAALELKLAPESVAARKTLAKQGQRVEARREESGNASLSGRELDTADVIASKAYIDAIAVKLRTSGLVEGDLGRLRALALTDLTQGRDPLDRIKPPAKPGPDAACHDDSAAERDDPSRGATAHPGVPAPLPALINLLIPADTLLGWSTAPGEAAGWGLLDADETRALVQAASRHPRTRWCAATTGPDGTAIGHGCAKGQYHWPENGPPPPENPPDARHGSDSSTYPRGRNCDFPGPEQVARLADLLRRLNAVVEPIARGNCDHENAESRYVPSRKLRHPTRPGHRHLDHSVRPHAHHPPHRLREVTASPAAIDGREPRPWRRSSVR